MRIVPNPSARSHPIEVSPADRARHPVSGKPVSLARRVNGADLLRLRSQSRLLPPAVIAEELETRIQEYRERMNERIMEQNHLGIKRFFNLDTACYRDGALDGKQKELTKLQMELRELKIRLSTDYPDYRKKVFSSNIVSVTEVQKNLGSQAALVSYTTTPEYIIVFTITKDIGWTIES